MYVEGRKGAVVRQCWEWEGTCPFSVCCGPAPVSDQQGLATTKIKKRRRGAMVQCSGCGRWARGAEGTATGTYRMYCAVGGRTGTLDNIRPGKDVPSYLETELPLCALPLLPFPL